MMIEEKIKEIINNFEVWANEQKSEKRWVEWMKGAYIYDVKSNVGSAKNIKDKVYWLERSTQFMADKFNTKLPIEIKSEINKLKKIVSFMD